MNSLKKMESYNKLLGSLLVLFVFTMIGCTEAGDKKEAATSVAAVADVDWTYYGGTQWNERHAQVNSITKNNVAQLVPRRVLQLGQVPYALSVSPVVVNGVMYIAAGNGIVQAFDLRTGMRKWSFTHPMDESAWVFQPVLGVKGPACCSNQSRGVAYADGMIFLGTNDAKMIALDAETGKVIWEVFGVQPKDNPNGGVYGYNSAPVALNNVVVIGSTGGDSPSRHHLTAYDQKTGAIVWRWFSIPAPDGSDPVSPDGWWGDYVEETAYGQKIDYRDIAKEKANKEKYKESWRIGGGAMWMPVAFDPDLNLIYVGTGNPNPDMDGRGRPGDNLYTNSIVAIDATSGKTEWYFQLSPHDLWDRDAITPPVVSMLDGRKVVVHGSKIGMMFVLDAATGEFIQKSETFVPQINMYAVPTDVKVNVAPGAGGGNNWSPISVDGKRKLGFVGAIHMPVDYTREKEIEADAHLGRSTQSLDLGGDWKYHVDEGKGYLSAIDLTTGKIKWQIESSIPFIGGVMSTNTGIIFNGESDGNFTAHDSETGEVLWQYNTGAGVNAPPIAFTLDGEDFIAVAAGGSKLWGSPLGDAVFVFGLPKKWEAPKK